MPEKNIKTITVDGKDYSYEGRIRVAGKTASQLVEVVADKFSKVPASEQVKIVDFLLNASKGKPVVKPLVAVAKAAITPGQLKDAKTYGCLTSADLAEVVKVVQGVIDEKEKADGNLHKGALASARKLGITPEELKKRISELDRFDAAHK